MENGDPESSRCCRLRRRRRRLVKRTYLNCIILYYSHSITY